MVTCTTIRQLPLLADCANYLADILPRWRRAMQITLWHAHVEQHQLRLLFRHRTQARGTPHQWQMNYQQWQPRSRLQADAIEQRLTSLGGCMQVLTKEISQHINRKTNNRGTCWEPRFRCCLLADDSALCAMALSMHQEKTALKGESANIWQPHHDAALNCSALPLLRLPSGQVIPADQGPLGTLPSVGDENLLADLQSENNHVDYLAWRSVWDKALAIGRPESLAETLGRFERPPSRGRRRRMRDLGDSWGLCGVWG
jgi:hypothetical protein